MSLRIETVDALQSVDFASDILCEAWQPPCMRYSPEYLRWQFSFPEDASALAVAAFDGLDGSPPDAFAEETLDLDVFLETFDACNKPTTLYNTPDRSQLEHYLTDPRRRALVVVNEKPGRRIGAAMVIRSEVCTHRGLEFVSSIDAAFLPSHSADALRAVALFAARRFAGEVTSPVVTAANLVGFDAVCLKGAGFRATVGRFAGHLFCPTQTDRILGALTTNHEIV